MSRLQRIFRRHRIYDELVIPARRAASTDPMQALRTE